MSRKTFDPLACIPTPDAVRQKLKETLSLAERLRILLDLSERLQQSSIAEVTAEMAARRQGVTRASC